MREKKNSYARRIVCFMILLACSGIFFSDIRIQAAKKLHIERPDSVESTENLSVGETWQLKANTEKVTYRSSDSAVACVNESGRVTGKRNGTVVITAKKAGYVKDKIKITVVKKQKKPALPVAVDEITVEGASLKEDKNGDMIFSAKIKNHAKNGKIKQAVLTYQAEIAKKTEKEEEEEEADETTGASIESVTGSAVKKASVETEVKNVSLIVKNIPAGKKSGLVSCQGDVSGNLGNMKLKKIKVYSGDAVHTYSAEEDSYRYGWGTEDKKAPEITGWVKKGSVSNGEPFRICYPDRKDSYHFKQHVKASDERPGKVTFTVDTSEINWKKAGIYKIRYTAADKAGNVAKAWAKVEIRMVDTTAEIADQILASITKEGWSNERKARAIYTYVKGHCAYVGHGPHTNWPKVAVNGFRYGSGDCFTYYSMAKALLTRAGIPNITITRYPLLNGAHHWWNLVYIGGGWYHFDTTPRTTRGYFCLVTDKQLQEYRKSSLFRYVSSDYPERAKKAISHGCNIV